MSSALFARFRRFTAAQWASRNPVLKDAEPGWDSTNKVLKIGDGSTAWSGLTSYGTGGVSTSATTSAQGIVELATSAEGIAGTDTVRAMTPKATADTIAAVSPTVPTATTSTQGKIQLATGTEATTGTDANKAITPATLTTRLASFSNATSAPATTTSTPGATFLLLATHLGTVRTMVLNANITVNIDTTLPSSSIADVVTLVLKQPSSGGPYTVTWQSTIEWPEDALGPAMLPGANAELIIDFFWTGSAWRASPVGRYQP